MPALVQGQVVVTETAHPLSRRNDAGPFEDPVGYRPDGRGLVRAAVQLLGGAGQRQQVDVGVDQSGQ